MKVVNKSVFVHSADYDSLTGPRQPAGRSGERAMDEPEPDPVILPIEDSLDLHPFAPRDVRSVVDEYLRPLTTVEGRERARRFLLAATLALARVRRASGWERWALAWRDSVGRIDRRNGYGRQHSRATVPRQGHQA